MITSHYIVKEAKLVSSELYKYVFNKDKHAIIDIHPKLAYLMWKDPKLRTTFISYFNNNFIPPPLPVTLKGYKDEFDEIYFYICHKIGHQYYKPPSMNTVTAAVEYYRKLRAKEDAVTARSIGGTPPNPAAGVGLLNSQSSTTGSPVGFNETRTISNMIQTPADFYSLPNNDKIRIIEEYLENNTNTNIPNLNQRRKTINNKRKGYFTKMFSRNTIFNKLNKVANTSGRTSVIHKFINAIRPRTATRKSEGSPPKKGGTRKHRRTRK